MGNGFGRDGRMVGRFEGEAQVGFAQGQAFGDLARVQGTHRKPRLRVFALHGGERLGQPVLGQSRHAEDAQHGVFPIREIARQTPDRIQLEVQLLDFGVQQSGFVRGHEPTLDPVEQGESEVAFRLLQQARRRWLRDMKQARGAFDGAALHHRMKNLEMAQSHGADATAAFHAAMRPVFPARAFCSTPFSKELT